MAEDLKEKVPAVLYKYVSDEYWQKILKQRTLRFSQPSVLNDPFEIRPTYKPLSTAAFTHEQLTDKNLTLVSKEIFEEELSKMPVEIRTLIPEGFIDFFSKSIAPQAKELAPTILDSFTPAISDGMFSSFDQMIGILSLSERNNDPLMWAHYARSHQGIVLGLDTESNFFNRRLGDKDDLRHLEKVRYATRPSIQVLEIENEHEIFFTKSEEWAYECEWRMLLPLKDADEVVSDGGASIYLFEYPSTCLNEVIFGYNTSDETRSAILSYIFEENQYSHVKVSRIELDNQKSKLNIVEIAGD